VGVDVEIGDKGHVEPSLWVWRISISSVARGKTGRM